MKSEKHLTKVDRCHYFKEEWPQLTTLGPFCKVSTAVSFTFCIIDITYLTLMLLVADLANIKLGKNPQILLKPWHMGTQPRELSESCPMNTNMTGFGWFSKFFVSLCFGQKKPQHWKG